MMPVIAAVILSVLGACASVKERPQVLVPSARPTWAMEGGNPARTGTTPLPVPRGWNLAKMIRLVPEERYHPDEHATPLWVDGVAVVGHSGRSFDAVRLRDGTFLWRFPTRGRVYTTAAWAEGLFLFGDDEGWFYAVDRAGRKRWDFRLSYPVVSSPLVRGGRVYVAVADQNVFCLEAATGRPLWQYGRRFPRRKGIWRSLGLCAGDGRVYAGFSDGTVVALDPEVGQVLWRAGVGGTRRFRDVTAGPVFAEGRVYAGALEGPVVCLEASTGKVLWRADVSAATGFSVGRGRVYAGTAAGSVVALAQDDGRVLWETPLDGGVPTVPVLAANAVVVGASDGSLFALDPEDGAVLERYTPGPGLHGQPLVFPEGVLILSDGGTLHWVR